jgi:hypothetical protein
MKRRASFKQNQEDPEKDKCRKMFAFEHFLAIVLKHRTPIASFCQI